MKWVRCLTSTKTTILEDIFICFWKCESNPVTRERFDMTMSRLTKHIKCKDELDYCVYLKNHIRLSTISGARFFISNTYSDELKDILLSFDYKLEPFPL